MKNKEDLLIEAVTIPSRYWTKAHVEVLPKQFLLDKVSAVTLYDIWQYLDKELQNDIELQSHLPCLEHYNGNADAACIDGPPPPKYRCGVCRKSGGA